MEHLLKEALVTIGLLNARLKCNQHLKLEEEKDVRAVMDDLSKALEDAQSVNNVLSFKSF